MILYRPLRLSADLDYTHQYAPLAATNHRSLFTTFKILLICVVFKSIRQKLFRTRSIGLQPIQFPVGPRHKSVDASCNPGLTWEGGKRRVRDESGGIARYVLIEFVPLRLNIILSFDIQSPRFVPITSRDSTGKGTFVRSPCCQSRISPCAQVTAPRDDDQPYRLVSTLQPLYLSVLDLCG
ncbi:hypothetical protein QCA50_007490 [Cerrena zonata]|uniref:Uncharacterized protein n=1 Tax=Cerrena zonata TaxID=2478898 RepID=A0AAW0GKR8_9APHY